CSASLVFHARPPSRTSPLSLHDALPISRFVALVHVLDELRRILGDESRDDAIRVAEPPDRVDAGAETKADVFLVHSGAERGGLRSEEHTSELQSRENLVCRLLLEKKKVR